MTDIEELKRLAEAHLSNFHADSMPPMKIEAQTVLALIRELEEARRDAGKLEIALDPRRWTQDMSDAWNRTIPDTVQAFQNLREAARQQTG